MSVLCQFVSVCFSLCQFWGDFETDETIKFLIIKRLHCLSDFFLMSAMNFRFFADIFLYFIIMLCYISNILFVVSVINNIYNIIYFSREVKGNFEWL